MVGLGGWKVRAEATSAIRQDIRGGGGRVVLIAIDIDAEKMWEEVAWLQTLLGELGVSHLVITFGFGCNLPIDDLYQPTPLATKELIRFLKWSSEKGQVNLGVDNFYFRDVEGAIAFRLDHEQAIAYRGSNDVVTNRIREHWRSRGIRCFAYPEEFSSDFNLVPPSGWKQPS